MSAFASRLLPLTFLLFLVPAVCAQRERDTYTGGSQAFEVSGQVRLAETGGAVRNVPVRLERFSGGVVDQISTDSQGRFRFPNLQRGYYRVIINSPGFNPAQQDADLQVLFRTFLVFDLISDKSVRPTAAAGAGEVLDVRVPADAREEFVRGRAALVKKDQPEAVAHLKKATILYSEFFEAHLLLGTSYLDLRQWENAEAALRRSLEIKPESSAALFSLGEVYWREKRFDEAEKTLLDGLKLDDKSWHGYFTLARLYWDKGEPKRAGPAVGRTLQLRPDFAEAHLLAGNILLGIGQQERAVIEYQEYLRLAPKGEFANQARELIERLSKSVVEKRTR